LRGSRTQARVRLGCWGSGKSLAAGVILILVMAQLPFSPVRIPSANALTQGPYLIASPNLQSQPFTQPWDGNGFYAQGRHWVFYEDHVSCPVTSTRCLLYATSVDGVSWSLVTLGVVAGPTPSIVTNGTHVFYARYDGAGNVLGGAIKFRVGQLHTDGTISWQAETTVRQGVSGKEWWSLSMRVSSSGQAFVAYRNATSDGGNGIPFVIHSNGIDYSTWQQETVLRTASDDWRFSLTPLLKGGVYILYWPSVGALRGRLWSGGSWGAEETVTPGSTLARKNAFAFNTATNTTYAIWQEDATKKIQFAVRNSSWGSPQQIAVSDTSSLPRWTASYDSLENKFYVIYYNYTTNQIYQYSGNSGAWSSKTQLFTTSGSNSSMAVGSYYQSGSINSTAHTLGIFWIQARNSTNFDLKFGNEITSAGWRTVNYDSGFDNPETAWCNHNGCPWSMTVDNFSYWVPSVGGNQTGCPQTDYGSTFINASVLHTREKNVDSTSSCFDTSIASEGNFPWMSTQQGCVGTSQKYVPIFTCPRNSYGEHEVAHSDFTYTNVSTHLTFNSRNTPTKPAHYAVLVDLYWWFNSGNVTAQGKTYAWMETAIRVASTTYSTGCSCWLDDPIGFNGTFDPGTNFAFHLVVAQVHPGDPTYYLSAFNATRLYQQALAAWSIPANTHGVLLGIQVGTEGYGSVLSVDFSDMTIGTHMPDAAAADTNFDHIINSLDTADEANSFGKCPNNHSTSPQAYKWTVDVAADSCNNILDSAYIAYYYGLSY